MFNTHCTNCGASNQSPPHYKGKSIKCASCGDQFIALEDGERPFKFHCAACGGGIEAEERMKGGHAPCPHCSQDILIAGDQAPSPPSRLPATLPASPTAVELTGPEKVVGGGTRSPQFSLAALIIILLLGVIIAGGGFVAYKQGAFTKPDPIVEAAKTPNYKEDLKQTLELMVLYASQAEDICQGHAKMWRSATESRYQSIDDAISVSMGLRAERIRLLKEGVAAVASNMKKLQGPPVEYVSVYDKLVVLFGQFGSFADLAVYPSGSLLTYTQSFRRLQEDLIRGINEIRVMIPE